MAKLDPCEQVVQEHVCLYMYSIRSHQFRIFKDVRVVKNIIYPNDPLYYIRDYSESSNPIYRVLPDAGKVQHSGAGTFKVWFAKADDSVGVKTLLDAVDIYTEGKIKKATNTIAKMQKQQDMAHKILDCMM